MTLVQFVFVPQKTKRKERKLPYFRTSTWPSVDKNRKCAWDDVAGKLKYL